jgi:hypothetical protein
LHSEEQNVIKMHPICMLQRHDRPTIGLVDRCARLLLQRLLLLLLLSLLLLLLRLLLLLQQSGSAFTRTQLRLFRAAFL